MSVLALSDPFAENMPTHVPKATAKAAVRPASDAFFASYDDIRAFVLREWERALDYRLKQETWTYEGDRISVHFAYEWHDAEAEDWVRTIGAEHWVVGADGLIRCEDKAITDAPAESQSA